jgi:hypothetical protein
VDGGRPDRIVEGGAKNPDDGGVHAPHRGLRAGSTSEHVPERERPDLHQDPGQEDPGETQGRAGHAVRLRCGDRPQVGGEGEERARLSFGLQYWL